MQKNWPESRGHPFRVIPRKPALFSTFPSQLLGHSVPGSEQASSPLTAVGSSVSTEAAER